MWLFLKKYFQDSPARRRAIYGNTRTTGNPELPLQPLSCSLWRGSSVRNSTSPSRRERSSPAPSASQRHRSRSGFRTVGPRPRDFKRPSWRSSSWQRSHCYRPSHFPSLWAHPWAHRPSTGPWTGRDLPYLSQDYSVDLMGCTTCLNPHWLWTVGRAALKKKMQQITNAAKMSISWVNVWNLKLNLM